jgi:prephenate dehydrogenase
LTAPVAIVGAGLIGTSLALALRRSQPNVVLVGVDRPHVIEHPRVIETFTTLSTDLDAVADAGIIVLAAPVRAILDSIARLKTKDAQLITDTGSTKRTICDAARAANLDNFVGGHPMAGSDRSGPDAARSDLFDARPWFLVGAPSRIVEAGSFVQRLGAVPVFMTDDGERHDSLMAAVSHLPQVVASALMARIGEVVGEDGLAYAGSGLRDTTRLAGSEASVWESILATNADTLRPLLTQLADDLKSVAGQLDDPTAMRRLFGMANMYRRTLTGRTQ